MKTEYLTIDELSKYLKIPKSTLYKMTMTKRMPCAKIGKQLRFRKSAIDRWVENQENHK